ncbi:glucosamine-6-phosphate deaminase [Streptococcus hyovaginalis]|uniref:glucosamine-6-phosphate deaminase n=1 Tax=Streptococcus hyovaginalis TaxID=149015 RepID=UPI002A80D6C8|nr:glucosamine-6-phosphate deaminase [Streptococcus hyovaginalis]MDY4510952.1 glucosamine-6-phosphate deaminase [Streptococcus hyovaginalis]
MNIITVKDAQEGGKVAFELLAEKMATKIKTLGLATGSSPLGFYEAIRQSELDFSDMVSINLDEYVGIDDQNEQSYAYFMQKELFDAKPFKVSYLPDGKADDLEAAAKAYDQIIAENPIDFQILGIGRNGHIGFNEPGTSFDETTHIVDLAPSTIEANSRFFDSIDEVPKQAMSMGIASIMASKTIVLMAFGAEKAEAIKQMIQGPVTESLPASVLQKHKDVIVIIDEAAGSKL